MAIPPIIKSGSPHSNRRRPLDSIPLHSHAYVPDSANGMIYLDLASKNRSINLVETQLLAVKIGRTQKMTILVCK